MRISSTLIYGVGLAAMVGALAVLEPDRDPPVDDGGSPVCWCNKSNCKYTCCLSWCWEEGDCCLGETPNFLPQEEFSTGPDADVET